MSSSDITLLVLACALLGLFLVVGVPVGIALGGSAMLGMFIEDQSLLTSSAVKLYGVLQNPLLLAIPLFILTGNIAAEGGIARTLIRMGGPITRRLPGAELGQIVPISLFFSGLTGSSAADVAAVGTFLGPSLTDRGYSKTTVNALIASAGALGILFPPSVAIILYSSITSVSVIQLFQAAFIPAVAASLGVLFFSVLVALRNRKLPEPSLRKHVTARVVIQSIATLILPAILIIGVYGGFATISEISAVAAVFVLLITIVLFYREHRGWLRIALVNTFKTTVAILTILVGASVFAFVLTDVGVVTSLTNEVGGHHLPNALVLILAALLVLVLGSVMEGLSILLVLVPVLVPVLESLNVSPLQAGIVVAAATELGVIVPPFGINLLTVASIQNVKMRPLARACLPHVLVIACVLLLVAIVPDLTTWLPGVLNTNK